MRMIILLAALLIVGLLVYRQLELGSSTHVDQEVEKIRENVGVDVPKAPVKPQDVQAFGQQVNTFINDAAAVREKQLEQQSQ